ncbi:hypothetical protein ACLKA6_005554 [Drosophila palustris]
MNQQDDNLKSQTTTPFTAPPNGCLWLWLCLVPTPSGADESLDTREGVDLVLKCRFTEHYDSTDFTFYWARWTCCPTLFENVAIGDVQLNSNYR